MDEEDRDWFLGLATLEMEEEANRCPACGGDVRECQNPANRFKYDIESNKCFKQATVIRKSSSYMADKYASAIVPRIKILGKLSRKG